MTKNKSFCPQTIFFEHNLKALLCWDTKRQIETSNIPIFLLSCRVENVQKTRLTIDNNLFPVRVFDSWVVLIDETVKMYLK